MGRLVCFIDKEGMTGTCTEEASGQKEIDCKKCEFRKKFEGKEKEEFYYCLWKGKLS